MFPWFPQIQTGPGTWREDARGLHIIILTCIKCHFSQRMFPTAIEFQVRIKLIHVGELTWFWILCCFELTNRTTIFSLHFQYFQLNDASFLMYAKMCILHSTLLKEKVLKLLNILEQLMYLPPKGSIPENIEVDINILFIRFPFLKLITHPGK